MAPLCIEWILIIFHVAWDVSVGVENPWKRKRWLPRKSPQVSMSGFKRGEKEDTWLVLESCKRKCVFCDTLKISYVSLPWRYTNWGACRLINSPGAQMPPRCRPDSANGTIHPSQQNPCRTIFSQRNIQKQNHLKEGNVCRQLLLWSEVEVCLVVQGHCVCPTDTHQFVLCSPAYFYWWRNDSPQEVHQQEFFLFRQWVLLNISFSSQRIAKEKGMTEQKFMKVWFLGYVEKGMTEQKSMEVCGFLATLVSAAVSLLVHTQPNTKHPLSQYKKMNVQGGKYEQLVGNQIFQNSVQVCHQIVLNVAHF